MIKKTLPAVLVLLANSAIAQSADARPEINGHDAASQASETTVDGTATAADAQAATPDAPAQGRTGKRTYFHTDGGGRQGFLGRYKAVWSSLDLSEEQRDKLFALQQRLKKTFFDAEAAKEEATYALQTGLAADTLAEDALGASAEAAANAERQLLQARIDFVKEMRSILTPDQVQKLHEQMRTIAKDAQNRVRSRRRIR